jgi:hypothetical protein
MRLSGSNLSEFLDSLGLARTEPVGRSSDSGERADEARLLELLQKGDPLAPGPGRVSEDAQTVSRLLTEAGEFGCLGLTPDGHESGHEPIILDAERAVEQVIHLQEADIAGEDKEEALAATWLALAYHDHDHPADFGGILRDAGDGKAKCCYLDVKGTRALTPGQQRTKLEQRAQEQKFGCLAQTVTRAADNGFAGYPGRGKPGLLVTLLHNPVQEGKRQSGYAMGWFFGIRRNYQAAAAVWGWGGPLGVRLPDEMREQLASRRTILGGQERNFLELLGEYRDYGQFKDAQGTWDRESRRATLSARFLAGRYLLMNEDPVAHAEATVAELRPAGVAAPPDPEDFRPGESFASSYGRKYDREKEERLLAEERARKADESARKTAERAQDR